MANSSMAELKNQRNRASVKAFLDAVPDACRRQDANVLRRLMSRLTGKRATMWGDALVGFGSYHYEHASGR